MDSKFIRKQFSALNDDYILFENAGGTQVPDQVIKSVADFYRQSNAQPGHYYSKSVRGGESFKTSRQIIADLIGASEADEIVFGPTATTLSQLMVLSMMGRWQAGDEIIVTISDHEANINPWLFAQKHGLKIKFWNINRDSFELNLEDLEKLLSPHTVLVAFPHISNILGIKNDVARITKMARQAGAWVYVDGVASTPHTVVDVKSWGVDFFVMSTYKLFGPHMAALYCRKDHLKKLETVNHFFLPKDKPKKFELGTSNLEGCAAIIGLKNYMEKVFENEESEKSLSRRDLFVKLMEKINKFEIELAWQLIDGLKQNPAIRIIGPSDKNERERRVPVVAFTINGKKHDDIVRELAARKIGLGCSHFYAYRLIDYLGLINNGGVIRASLVHYNTADEIDRFLKELFEIIS